MVGNILYLITPTYLIALLTVSNILKLPDSIIDISFWASILTVFQLDVITSVMPSEQEAVN